MQGEVGKKSLLFNISQVMKLQDKLKKVVNLHQRTPIMLICLKCSVC